MTERVHATYWIETPHDPRAAVEVMAGEQSSGTFVSVPGETPELKARFGARVERLDILGESERPSLPGARLPKAASGPAYRTAKVELSWPLENMGASLPNLMATVAGNLFELGEFSGLRILDITLSPSFAAAYPGPAFGIEGTRHLAGVEGHPLIGTIIKPSVGLSAQDTAALVDTLCAAGIDFIKDDELQGNGLHCPFEERATAVMSVINRHAERSGRKVMYAFNLTGELDEMLRRHDLVEGLGGTCVMVSLNSVGLVGFSAFRRHARLPIHAHRNGWGYLSRSPALGWSYIAWQKFWRLAGADHMHVNGLWNKFSETDDSVIASARECLTPLFPDKPCTVMPVFSSGQSVHQPPDTYAALGSADLIYAAGGGIMAHPSGPGAGVKSLRQAWDATIGHITLEDYAKDHGELAEALTAYKK